MKTPTKKNRSRDTIRPKTAQVKLPPLALKNREAAKPGDRPVPVKGEKEIRKSEGLNWPVILWIGTLHVGALAAPFFFSWQGLVLALAFHWITGGLGICLGYHRMLTHTSFSTYRPVRLALAWIGGLAGEGDPIEWTANHRKHHAHSDQEGDPHSPRDGAWWSHIFWLAWMRKGKKADYEAHLKRWVPDLAKDEGMRQIGRLFIASHFLVGALMTYIGYLYGGWYMALSFLTWGMFARLVFVLHTTWLVNSASHIWGYRNYETTDDSRNNWLVALLTYGEGWHNNHHAYPRMANHGHKWWEIDLTFRFIRLMQRCGLAWDIVDYKQRTKADRNPA